MPAVGPATVRDEWRFNALILRVPRSLHSDLFIDIRSLGREAAASPLGILIHRHSSKQDAHFPATGLASIASEMKSASKSPWSYSCEGMGIWFISFCTSVEATFMPTGLVQRTSMLGA